MNCEWWASSFRILSLIEGSMADCASGTAATSAVRRATANVRYFITPHYMRRRPWVLDIGLRAALSIHSFGRECMVLGEIDEILRPGVGLGETLEIAEQVLDARDVDAAQAVGQPFAVMPLLLKERDEALDCFRRAPRGNLGRDTRRN